MKKLKEAIAITEKILNDVRNELAKEIIALPDNPNIHRIGHNGFVMSSSNLDSNLTLDPFYYDFNRQYKYIATLLKEKEARFALLELETIVKKGCSSGWNDKKRFHPEVIKQLKKFME
ncbi:MAG TPA: hypothetical protein P5136_02570 [Methanofastidiosum sp.]|nr:hypothetical protein [Methanofastidiosum sp.]